MPLWGNRDQYSDAPKYTVHAHSGKKGQQLYGNSVFLADATETTVNKTIAHPGWVRRIVGTGPIKSITINSGGTLYSNSDTISVSGGSVNATANIVTNGSGVITAINITNIGAGFTNSLSTTITVTTSTGSTANLAPVFGGRAGRIKFETLIALATTVGDAVNFANTSTANVANSSGTVDDAILPDA
jgi:hypothetical protein